MAPNVGRIAWAVAALALSTSAQSQFGTVGALSPGSLGDTPEAKELLAEYGRTPNATSQLTFNRSGEHMLETWGWRLNVTEVPVPNNPRLFGNASANSSENLTVTNVQWQLDWPGDESDTLQSFLGQRNWTLFSWNLRAVLPLNITDHINSETKDNCSAILGAECAASLEEQAAQGRDASFSDLAGCASTLDVGYQGGWGFGNEFPLSPPFPLERAANPIHSLRHRLQRHEQQLALPQRHLLLLHLHATPTRQLHFVLRNREHATDPHPGLLACARRRPQRPGLRPLPDHHP
nr:hypothetical protein CFP56_10492 [Quercus suber]